MKSKLLFLFAFFCLVGSAQAPAIEGDLMLCPNEDGTAVVTGDVTYDTYQWYYKYWFLSGDFEVIDGATSSSFTYDWFTYDQALFKVVVTLDGETFESNTIQIDSYAWLGIFLSHELNDNVTFDPNSEGFLLCQGSSFEITINNPPYDIITWYKDGEIVDGANSSTYSITEAGQYYAVAAPSFCPGSTSTSLPINVSLTNCSGIELPVIAGDEMLCPNEDGTAIVTNDVTYDSYQWYYKYWFLSDDFEAVDGATSSTFVYDWMTYDQALLKVVVTLDGETFESNTIQIDSYNWTSLLLSYDLGENVTIDGDNGDLLMCEGTTLEVNVGMPYTIVTWYKDGEVIEGETSTTYTITEAGVYHVVAAPGMCPNATSTSLPIIVYLVACESDNPIIEGDVMLCPYEDGTAVVTGDIIYDTYQWYYKYWFSDDDFEVIDGATSSIFIYDWLTYDQALLKVVVTLDGETFESNTIQIDSHNWSSLLLSYDLGDNVTYDGDDEIFYMCQGTTLEINVMAPYTIITWYKDGEIIEGETSMSYTITEAGSYYVVAAPAICPNATSTSPALNIQMAECDLSVENPNGDLFIQLYPNPVNDMLYISSSTVDGISNYIITDTTGREISKGELAGSENSISFENLPAGIYMVKIKGENYNSVHKIVKK